MARRNVLIVDDDLLFCDIVADAFGDRFEVEKAASLEAASRLCATGRFDVVLLDNALPDGDGLALVPELLAVNDRTKIVLVTGYPSFENAVRGLKTGVYDYLSKPIDIDELRLAIERALRAVDLEQVEQLERYRNRAESGETVLIGTGPAFDELRRVIARAAAVDAPVLITGETGTGKGLVAKAIHFASRDRSGGFVGVNCAALPETLVESELFGVERGAFTGATATRKGLFEIADGGTLFLDEIAEMPVALQAKLLGVLEDRAVRRLGGEVTRPVNARIVAATNAEPERAISEGRMRRDLYYRLNVVHLHLPPLRDRLVDIPALCAHFLERIAPGRRLALAPDEVERLAAYDWPGNVRELRNVLERTVILQDAGALAPSRLLGTGRVAAPVDPPPSTAPASATLEAVERDHILRTFAANERNYTQTAAALGISLSTLKRKIRGYGAGGDRDEPAGSE